MVSLDGRVIYFQTGPAIVYYFPNDLLDLSEFSALGMRFGAIGSHGRYLT